MYLTIKLWELIVILLLIFVLWVFGKIINAAIAESIFKQKMKDTNKFIDDLNKLNDELNKETQKTTKKK